MNSLIKTTILSAAVTMGVNLWAGDHSTVEVKGDSLRQLQELRTKNVKRLQELDSALAKTFEDTKTANLEKNVTSLKSEKHEFLLRQEFLDRMIFQLDTKFNGGDLRAFLERALVEMAKIDATSSAQAGDGLWKFLKYSADAIHRLPEQKENILSFLEGYMNLGLANPILPEEYLATRNYTNGSKSEMGKPLDRAEVGDIADRRLHEMITTKAAPLVQQQ